MDNLLVRSNRRYGMRALLLVLHLSALALLPFFSWWAVLSMFVLWVLTGLGVTVGYHRLLTHGSFETRPRIAQALAVLGLLSGEGPPIFWIAFHRRHHQFSDKPGDPHSPEQDGFGFAHMGWLWAYDTKTFEELFKRYAPEESEDPFFKWLDTSYGWWHAGLAILLIGIGAVIDGWYGAVSFFGYSFLLRLLVGLHVTWCVNSVTHRWGYRNYETKDNSRNNWLFALPTLGEAWHNNHHAQPRAANHGWHRWWEFDASYCFIWLLARCRLAWNVVRSQSKQTLQE